MIEKTSHKIQILVAESIDLIRIGLRSVFENHPAVRLIADTKSLEDLFLIAPFYKPDVILVDLLLGDDHYAGHIVRLLRACPQSKVLALSHHDNELDYLQIFRAGAAGVISAYQSAHFLSEAIRAVHAGEVLFDRNIIKLARQTAQFDCASPAMQPSSEVQQPFLLSDYECRIAHLACNGLSIKSISRRLCVTEKTVRNQLSLIYKKMGIRKQVELCLKVSRYNYFK